MRQDPRILRKRLQQLQEFGPGLAELLSTESSRLESSGAPPSKSLLDDLQLYRDELNELTKLVYGDGSVANSQSLGEIEKEIDRQSTVTDVSAVLDRVAAIENLDDAQFAPLLECRREVQALRQQLTTSQEIPAAALAIEAGSHPVCALLTLVSSGDRLSDAQWNRLQDIVTDRYGRTMGTAAARGRLRVSEETLTAATVTEVPSQKPGTTPKTAAPIVPNQSASSPPTTPAPPPVVAAPQPHVPAKPTIRPVPEPKAKSADPPPVAAPAKPVTPVAARQPSLSSAAQESALFDDSDLIMTRPATSGPTPAITVKPPVEDQGSPQSNDRGQTIFDDDGPLPNSAAMVLKHNHTVTLKPTETDSGVLSAFPQQFVTPQGPEVELATQIQRMTSADRSGPLADLVLRLICAGRSGLAYHFAKCLERRDNTPKPFPPSWWIRAWTLGQHLLFPKGHLAGLLQDDFSRFRPETLAQAKPEWATAYGILLRAAALRPAVVAPMTRAAAILRTFDMQSETVQLYNYCSRIGSYGEKMQGFYPGTYKRTNAVLPRDGQLAALQADISRWRDEVGTRSVHYATVPQLYANTHWSLRAGSSQRFGTEAYLWWKWQQTIQMAEGIIRPIYSDNRTELAHVKSEMDRLSTHVSIGHEADLPANSANVAVPLEAMRNYLRQAISFGQRWVVMHDASTADGQPFIPQQFEELRNEVENRHQDVLNELHRNHVRQGGLPAQTAAACLTLALQSVRDLVDPKIPADAQEPDPRHLLNSELLKVPDLRLDGSWEPTVDWHTMEDDLLRHLVSPQPDWQTAFQLQLHHGNYDSVERILQLPVWSAEQKATLQSLRDQKLAKAREGLWHDLKETEQMIGEAVRMDLLNDQDRAGFETRLERLRRTLNDESDVNSGTIELERLRTAVQRTREREAFRIRTRLKELEPSTDSKPGWVMDFSKRD